MRGEPARTSLDVDRLTGAHYFEVSENATAVRADEAVVKVLEWIRGAQLRRV
jgi:hypothetical protein